jgi:DNA modification methylase
MIVKLKKLKVHRIHSEIYVVNDLDDLKQSIQKSGLLEKIVVNNVNELVILSGVRRFHALKELGYTDTDVIISNTPSSDESLTLISFNKQRQKTATEMVNEIENLKLIWAVKRGRKPANFVQCGKVNTRARTSQTLHVSSGNISKLELINKKKPELLAQIDQGKYTINQVHKYVLKLEEKKNVIDINANLPIDISNDYYKIFNETSADLSKIPNETVQMIFTSPPFWKLRNYTNSKNELGQEDTSEEYVQRLADHLHDCYRVLKPEGSFFLNLGDTFDNCLQSIPHRVQIELSKRSWNLKQTIVWKKLNPLPASGKRSITQSFEFIFHFVKSNDYYYDEILTPLNGESKPRLCEISRKSGKDGVVDFGRFCIAGLKNAKKLENFWTPDIVYTATANQAAVKKYGGTDHPAPFPEQICIMPILQTTKPGDTVLDLFSGSGTTGAVALMLGRKYIGYELEPNHNSLQAGRFNDAIKSLDDAIMRYNQAELKKAA